MKRHNLMKKTFDKVFQSNIAVRYYLSFQCEEIQSCWDIWQQMEVSNSRNHNDTFYECPACLPSLSPKSFEPPSSKEKVTTPQSLRTLELQNIFESDCNIWAGVWGCADIYIWCLYFIFISYIHILYLYLILILCLQLVSEGVLIAGWGATGFRQPTSDKLLQGTIRFSKNNIFSH